MANGMRLVAQVIGAALAIVLATEAGTLTVPDTVFADSMNIANLADNLWPILGMIAAGAIWWQIHTRCDTAWVSAIALLGLGGTSMTITGSHYMGASIVDGGTEIANVLVNWITDGLFVGLGALIGVKIDEVIDGMDSGGEEEAAE